VEKEDMGICKGRTVIITGAGGGLGANMHWPSLLKAARSSSTTFVPRRPGRRPGSSGVGGAALANSDDITSMAGARSIVDAAVKQFGDVTGIVNNAGVVRDRMFASLSEEDWDLVVRVHLKGTSASPARWCSAGAIR